ncbi:MAG: ATPase domain-containing protein, partial [Thermoplasmata archaeon]
GLELLNRLEKPEDGIYISTKVPGFMLERQFEWITDEWLEQMAYFLTPKSGETLTFSIGKFLESKNIEEKPTYEKMKERASNRSLIVIDSIEGLSKLTGLDIETIIDDFRKNVLIKRGVNMVVIEEGEEDSSLDAVVDGIIKLHYEIVEGKVLRYMEIRKMRGVQIESPYNLFTLQGGRFVFIEQYPYVAIPIAVEKKKWEGIRGPEGQISTGNPELDRVLDGRLKKGTIILIIFDDDVPNELEYLFELPIAADGLVKGMGIAQATGLSSSTEHVIELLKDFVGEKIVNENTIFLEEVVSFKRTEKNLVVLGSEPRLGEDMLRWFDAVDDLRKRKEKGVIKLVGYDYFDLRYSKDLDELSRYYARDVKEARAFGDTMIISVRKAMKSVRMILPIADIVLRMANKNGVILLWGEKPRTQYYGVLPDYSVGLGRMKLWPIS